MALTSWRCMACGHCFAAKGAGVPDGSVWLAQGPICPACGIQRCVRSNPFAPFTNLRPLPRCCEANP